jgi:hypothetical protein
MKTRILAMLAILAMVGVANATLCDIPGSGCTETGWDAPNCAGGYGGFDGVGCQGVAMVVKPGVCDGSETTASVDQVTIKVTSAPAGWSYCQDYGHLAVNSVENDGATVKVRYLDGFDDDAFDVFVGEKKICSVTMVADGAETWETAECKIPQDVTVPEAGFAVALIALLVPGVMYVTRKRA